MMADIYDQLKAWEHEAEQLKKVNKKLRKKNSDLKSEVERLRYDRFLHGYVCAVATLIRLEDDVTTNVKELWEACCESIEACKKAGCDQYDLEILNKYKDELEHKRR